MLTVAGTLMGLTNTFATLPGFIGPAVVGAITQGNVSVMIRLLNADMIRLGWMIIYK